MREIKFRAWNKVRREMFESAIYNAPDSFDMILKHPQVYVPMQYTGLKDKNGVEIYEDDILDITTELFTNFGNTPTGKFDTTYKQVLWKEDGWAVRTLKSENTVVGSEVKILTIPAKFGVVIGNIYETPDLLEDKQ